MTALRPIATPDFLSSLHNNHSLPKHTFYFIASVVLSVINRPEEVPRIWKYAVDNVAIPGSSGGAYVESELRGSIPCGNDGRESALEVHRKIREGILKSSPIGGLPKAINALNLLKTATPPQILAAPSSTGRRLQIQPDNHLLVHSRGAAFFDNVYGKISRRVMGGMQNSYDDMGVIAELMYGHVWSNVEVLGARDTSFVLIAGLIPQDVSPQLKGHLKGALNNGAAVQEVLAVREVVLRICKSAGMCIHEASVPSL